jgi:hypothetical protein
MKFDELRALAHNIADSLASGIGLMVGVYEMDVFGDASRSPGGFIEMDFLDGSISDGCPSPQLTQAVALYGQALTGLCDRHQVSPSDFRELKVRYNAKNWHFLVTIEDCSGRRSTDEYEGIPGRRVRELDALGRVRTNRHPVKPRQ